MSPNSAAPRPLRILHVWRGFSIAVALALAFLAGSAVQSAATLAMRLQGNDVMEAASSGVWAGQIGRDIALFVLAQVVMHVGLAVVVFALALATAVLSETARVKFGRTVTAWFCLLAAAIIAYNAYWFPRTGLGAYYHDALATMLGPVPLGRFIYLVVVLLAGGITLAAVVDLLRRPPTPRVRRAVGIAAGATGVAVLVLLVVAGRQGTAAEPAETRPNVILLGIDSLRLEELRRFGGSGVTPHLDRFLATSDIVTDTTTPVARTFPSWVAILTGRSPGVTGARYNLADPDSMKLQPTLGDVLARQGYRTVYATDEVRFANIDEGYGFSQVVTPPIGASDFLIGTYNELPLATVVVNSRLGQFLFPFSHANRGVAALFQPETFLARVDREVRFDGPTLFVAHLTASHWPYYVSDTTFGDAEKANPEDRPLYRIGLQTADEMFGRIVSMLERKGALRNAIVVVLSDHGEALGLPADTLLTNESKIDGLKFPLMVNHLGHGQSVLSPVQYQLLLSFRSFGVANGLRSTGRDLPGGATVEDIAPTLLGLLGIEGDPLHATGQSLAALLRGDGSQSRAGSPQRVRFTETDLKVLPDAKGGIDEVATASQNSRFFEVDPNSGRIHIRSRYVPLVLAFKERAAFTDDLLLVALPAGPDAHEYLLLDRKAGNGRVLMGPPDPANPDERHLWDRMMVEFGGEMQTPTNVELDDMPAIDQGWQDFFRTRERRPQAEGAAAGG